MKHPLLKLMLALLLSTTTIAQTTCVDTTHFVTRCLPQKWSYRFTHDARTKATIYVHEYGRYSLLITELLQRNDSMEWKTTYIDTFIFKKITQ